MMYVFSDEYSLFSKMFMLTGYILACDLDIRNIIDDLRHKKIKNIWNNK